MRDIKAFVGHSFSKDDEHVVKTFLEFFTHVAKIHPSFSWDHAEEAEPKLLQEKILEKIEGKNTFIGICTKRELAIDGSATHQSRLWSNFLWGTKQNFTTKASDWIIQEIGLAIGRGCELILLVEDGLRRPGGLQGDIEYITFKRASPADSFGKIMNMLSALSPKSAQQTSGAVEPKPAPQDDVTKNTFGLDEAPKPDWSLEKFERSIGLAVMRHDASRIAEIEKEFRCSKLVAEPDAIPNWNAHLIYMKILFDWEGDLDALIGIAKKHPDSASIRNYLAGAYDTYTEHEKSAQEYEVASRLVTDPIRKSRFLGRAAIQLQRAGNLPRALTLMSDIRRQLSEGAANELTLLQQLKDIFEAEKSDDLLLAAMERIVELEPSDVETRFALAFKHTSVGNEDLALHHYLKIPYEKRAGVAWNNLGVSFEHFKLPIKSIDAYRKAKEANETLAMANLGFKFASVGFLEEARAEAEKAFKQEHPHKNVGLLHAELEEAPKKETEELNKVMSNMKPKVDLYRQFGLAIVRPEADSLSEKWQGPKCIFTLNRTRTGIQLRGSYVRPASPFQIFMGEGAANTQQIVRTIEIVASQAGRAFVGSIKRTDSPSSQKTVLGDDDDQSEVFVFLNTDCSELTVAESPKSSNPTIVSLSAIK